MDVADTRQESLAAILRVYRTTSVAEALGISRNTVHLWATDQAGPNPEMIVKLADFLKMDVGAITRIVANDSERRRSRVISAPGAA